MAATANNQFWKLRSSHGRDKIFETPQMLLDAAYEYFEATDKRKWLKKDWVGKDAKQVERETETPYTLKGLCLFLDIDEDTFNNYSTKENYKDFFGVCTRIRDIIWTQKFEGAAVGAFNHAIIASELGIISKREIDLSTKGQALNKGLDLSKCSLEQLEMLQQLQEQCKPQQG